MANNKRDTRLRRDDRCRISRHNVGEGELMRRGGEEITALSRRDSKRGVLSEATALSRRDGGHGNPCALSSPRWWTGKSGLNRERKDKQARQGTTATRKQGDRLTRLDFRQNKDSRQQTEESRVALRVVGLLGWRFAFCLQLAIAAAV